MRALCGARWRLWPDASSERVHWQTVNRDVHQRLHLTYTHFGDPALLFCGALRRVQGGAAKLLILKGLILIKKRATHLRSSFYKDLPRIFNGHPQTYPQVLLMSGFSSSSA